MLLVFYLHLYSRILKNDGRYAYVWNAFDQLTEVKTLSGSILKTYRYDENGRRVYSKDNNGETYYRYNGLSNQVLFEEDASGVIIKSYTYDDSGLPLTMTYRDKTYYYLTNYRGDVLALTDESGTIVAEYTYDAWGNILTQKDLDQKEEVNLTEVNPYRFAGYRYDEETKLYYLMARYYNPDMGVFLSLDPVRGDSINPITMNGYNYANNNPVMFVDPDGEYAWVLNHIARQALKAALKNPKSLKYIYKEISSFLRNKTIRNALNKLGYKVTSNQAGGYILRVYNKSNKRVLSIDYHSLNIFRKKGFDTRKTNIFHIHLGNDKIHYIPASMIPNGFKTISNLDRSRYVIISKLIF